MYIGCLLSCCSVFGIEKVLGMQLPSDCYYNRGRLDDMVLGSMHSKVSATPGSFDFCYYYFRFVVQV